MYWSLHRDDLCTPSGCDDHVEVRDDDGKLVRYEPCDHCPLNRLDNGISRNPVFARAIDLDFALTAGFNITLDEVDAEEFAGLRVLRSERDKYQNERMKSGNK